jgi:hypothetical protein
MSNGRKKESIFCLLIYSFVDILFSVPFPVFGSDTYKFAEEYEKSTAKATTFYNLTLNE